MSSISILHATNALEQFLTYYGRIPFLGILTGTAKVLLGTVEIIVGLATAIIFVTPAIAGNKFSRTYAALGATHVLNGLLNFLAGGFEAPPFIGSLRCCCSGKISYTVVEPYQILRALFTNVYIALPEEERIVLETLERDGLEAHYQVLGVPKEATDAEVREAYRKKALQYHPDKNPDNPDAEAHFKAVSEACQAIQQHRLSQQGV